MSGAFDSIRSGIGMGTQDKRPTIMVIDDDTTLNRLMSSQLKAEGYNPVSVHRWGEAKQLLAKM